MNRQTVLVAAIAAALALIAAQSLADESCRCHTAAPL